MKFSFAVFAVFALGAAAAQAAPLYLNGPVVDANGRSVVETGSNTFGYTDGGNFSVADDFTVAAGTTWSVQSLSFFGYQTSAAGFTFTSATWSIVSGDVNTGTVIASGANSPVTNEGLIGYRVLASALTATNRQIYQIGVDIADIDLSAGDYWVRWTLAGSSASGPFVPPTSDGRNGNAQQRAVAGGSYSLINDAALHQPVELPFAVNGTLVTATVPEPGSLALVLAAGLAGVGVAGRRKVA